MFPINPTSHVVHDHDPSYPSSSPCFPSSTVTPPPLPQVNLAPPEPDHSPLTNLLEWVRSQREERDKELLQVWVKATALNAAQDPELREELISACWHHVKTLINESETPEMMHNLPLAEIHAKSTANTISDARDEEQSMSVMLQESNVQNVQNHSVNASEKAGNVKPCESQRRQMLPPVELENGQFQCPVEGCGRTYKYKTNYRNHAKTHTSGSFVCSYCGKKFGVRSRYEDHVRVHTRETPFECELCKRKFRQKHTWKKHLLSKHRREQRQDKEPLQNVEIE